MVASQVATIHDTFIWRCSCGYNHEALKQLINKAKHLGEHCIAFKRRLSRGYSRGTKVKHLGENCIKLTFAWRFSHGYS